jgi:hypothetical protein
MGVLTAAGTGFVSNANSADCEPAGMLIVVGALTYCLFTAILMVRPPVGAIPLRSTMAVTYAPPIMELGERVILAKLAGSNVMLPLTVVPRQVTATDSVVVDETPSVPTKIITLLEPAGTVNVEGTLVK